jgi:hypothetical protein
LSQPVVVEAANSALRDEEPNPGRVTSSKSYSEMDGFRGAGQRDDAVADRRILANQTDGE